MIEGSVKNATDGHLLGRLLGLHPYAALLAIGLDWALFGSNLVGAGLGFLLGLIVALPLTAGIALLQRSRYGDGWVAALLKGIAVAALVGVPTPIFSAPILLSGILGAFARR